MTRGSASRMAASTRPNLEVTIQRANKRVEIRINAVTAKSTIRVSGEVTLKPRMRLKSVKPLLPPKPVLLRKKSSIAAKVSAWVMIEKYTPLTRERKAK